VFKGAYKDDNGQWIDVAVKKMKSPGELDDIDLHIFVGSESTSYLQVRTGVLPLLAHKSTTHPACVTTNTLHLTSCLKELGMMISVSHSNHNHVARLIAFCNTDTRRVQTYP
jgi:hypothetical protein